MSRSIWKGPFINNRLFCLNEYKPIKIWVKSFVIRENFIGKFVLVYNGKNFKKIFITREKVGYKFGEFITTRTFNLSKKHAKKMLNKKNKKK